MADLGHHPLKRYEHMQKKHHSSVTWYTLVEEAAHSLLGFGSEFAELPHAARRPKAVTITLEDQMMRKEAAEGAENTSTRHVSAIIIANPTSGNYFHHTHRLQGDIALLRQQGWDVDLKLTQAPGDATRLAQEAVAEGLDVVVAAGGDGTINEVIQALAGTETTLGVLPLGTVNVWAREMAIPRADAGALDVLLHGQIRRIDLGRVNERYFLLMAGIGLDGEITFAVEKKTLKRLGVFGYVLASLWYGAGYAGFRVEVKVAERIIRARALQIIIGNTQLYGGAFKFTWQARCDDGLLDLCIVRTRNLLGRVLVLANVVRREKHSRHGIDYITCDSIEVRTRRPVAFQLDGETAGHTPAVFTAVPAALKVIVPQNGHTGLFSKDASSCQVS